MNPNEQVEKDMQDQAFQSFHKSSEVEVGCNFHHGYLDLFKAGYASGKIVGRQEAIDEMATTEARHQEAFESGKELSHEDMFRLVKHHQRAAQLRLQEASELSKALRVKNEEIERLNMSVLGLKSSGNAEKITALESRIERLREALDRTHVCGRGYSDEDCSACEALTGDDKSKEISK